MIQRRFILIHRFVLLVPLHVEVSHKLMEFGVCFPAGINRRHRLEGIVDHLEPVIKPPQEKLLHRIMRILRNVVFVNQLDLDKLEIEDGSEITVKSKIGKMKVEAVAARIREGNVAMFYPEANVIVPAILDPKSKTPAFKRVEVTLSTT